MSFCQCIVDICTECMERCTTFLEHFATSHFSTAYTAADLDLDTFCTYSHSVGYCHLDGSTVAYTTLDLTSDGVGYDAGINLRTLNFINVDLNVLLGNLLKLFLEFVNF